MVVNAMTDWKSRQNSDGGWAYGRGCSWTEPTVLVLMAQSVTQKDSESYQQGIRFLHSVQRSDGGLSPQSGVTESTWVTAMSLLLPEEATGRERAAAAMQWLKAQTGRESGWVFRLRQKMAGSKDEYPEAMPWFPGAAAWVIPTAISLLAFQRVLKKGPDSLASGRIQTGREFLFTRMCADGGWNHGSNRALGRVGVSYPDTTGIALLALHGAPGSAQLERGKAAARRHLTECRSAEGIAWLRMGLAAHGESVQASFTPIVRRTVDAALLTLADSPRNPLLS
jgi:hypothetical protein